MSDRLSSTLPRRLGEGSAKPTVLIVDHDDLFVESLGDELAADGYHVASARTTEDVCRAAQLHKPVALLVGELANRRAAIGLLDAIRDVEAPFDPNAAVIVLSSSGSLGDVLRAFEHGADDVVPRPIEYPELRMRLRARLHARLRNARPPRTREVLRVGELVIDVDARSVRLSGRSIALSNYEFVLLAYLAREPERVFSKAQLMEKLWGYPAGTVSRTLDSHACRLRRKLAGGGEATWVRNVWGVGYALLLPGQHQGSTSVLRAA